MTLENFKKTKMKEIAEFSTRISAEAWVGPLKEQGIPVLIQGSDCGGVIPELGMISGIKTSARSRMCCVRRPRVSPS